jgi:hypothetical protein
MEHSTVMFTTCVFFLGFGVSHYLNLRDKRRRQLKSRQIVLTYVLNHVAGDKERSFKVSSSTLSEMDVDPIVLDCLRTTLMVSLAF